MKESIGYTVTLNIVITFIIIIFFFLSASIIYFKSNKVSNVITDTIQKYEGYNTFAIDEIRSKLSSLGYASSTVNCSIYRNRLSNNDQLECVESGILTNDVVNARGEILSNEGYCVFECREMFDGEYYYYYKVSTNLVFNVPIINEMLNIPIFSNTSRLYDFECQLENFEDCLE